MNAEIGELTSGPFLSVREIASMLGLSTATVYSLIARGELVHVRVSNAIRVSAGALAAFLRLDGC